MHPTWIWSSTPSCYFARSSPCPTCRLETAASYVDLELDTQLPLAMTFTWHDLALETAASYADLELDTRLLLRMSHDLHLA